MREVNTPSGLSVNPLGGVESTADAVDAKKVRPILAVRSISATLAVNLSINSACKTTN
jgi:hypothetical protein